MLFLFKKVVFLKKVFLGCFFFKNVGYMQGIRVCSVLVIKWLVIKWLVFNSPHAYPLWRSGLSSRKVHTIILFLGYI